MRITFVTRTFGNVEHNSHCDVLHFSPVRFARLFLDCNGVFAIKAYYANALLFGIPDVPIGKLQSVQKYAARLVVRCDRRDHITPVLASPASGEAASDTQFCY